MNNTIWNIPISNIPNSISCSVLINENRLMDTDRPWLSIMSRLLCFVYADWLQIVAFHMTLITCVSCNSPPCALCPNKQ